MALLTNLSNNKQSEEIARTIAIKLKLEESMSFEVRGLFRKMSSAFAEHYKHHNEIIDLHEFDIDMTACIRKWYRKTASIFSKNVRDGLKYSSDLFEFKADNLENTNTEKNEINAEISAALLLFIHERSVEQTDMILNTSNEILKRQIKDEIEKRIAAGQVVNSHIIAEQVRKDFNERSISRSDTIAFQEVGIISSEAKQTEASVLNTSKAQVNVADKVVAVANKMAKNWNAELDMSTREAHVVADMTYKFNPIPVTERFIVGGEALMYPRDPVGSAGNTINCRCECLYTVKIL